MKNKLLSLVVALAAAFCMVLPVSAQTPPNINVGEVDGRPYLDQVYTVPVDTDPATLVQESVEKDGVTYLFSSTDTQQIPGNVLEKQIREQKLVRTFREELEAVFDILSETYEYDQDGYTGTLTMEPDTVQREQTLFGKEVNGMGVVRIEKGFIYLRDKQIGYLAEQNRAIVDQDALGSFANRWLMQHKYKVEWQAGVMQKLAQAQSPSSTRVHIYQLRDTAPAVLAQLTYDQIVQRYGGVDPRHYTPVYDGCLGTADVREVYAKLTQDPPTDYHGNGLMVSDIVELTGPQGTHSYFVDEIGFREIDFGTEMAWGYPRAQTPQVYQPAQIPQFPQPVQSAI